MLRFADAVRRAPDCARRCRRAGCRLASDCRAARRRLASRARGRELRRTRIAGGCGGRLRRSCRTPRVAPGVGRASAALRASDGRAPGVGRASAALRASDSRARGVPDVFAWRGGGMPDAVGGASSSYRSASFDRSLRGCSSTAFRRPLLAFSTCRAPKSRSASSRLCAAHSSRKLSTVSRPPRAQGRS